MNALIRSRVRISMRRLAGLTSVALISSSTASARKRFSDLPLQQRPDLLDDVRAQLLERVVLGRVVREVVVERRQDLLVQLLEP